MIHILNVSEMNTPQGFKVGDNGYLLIGQYLQSTRLINNSMPYSDCGHF